MKPLAIALLLLAATALAAPVYVGTIVGDVTNKLDGGVAYPDGGAPCNTNLYTATPFTLQTTFLGETVPHIIQCTAAMLVRTGKPGDLLVDAGNGYLLAAEPEALRLEFGDGHSQVSIMPLSGSANCRVFRDSK